MTNQNPFSQFLDQDEAENQPQPAELQAADETNPLADHDFAPESEPFGFYLNEKSTPFSESFSTFEPEYGGTQDTYLMLEAASPIGKG